MNKPTADLASVELMMDRVMSEVADGQMKPDVGDTIAKTGYVKVMARRTSIVQRMLGQGGASGQTIEASPSQTNSI